MKQKKLFLLLLSVIVLLGAGCRNNSEYNDELVERIRDSNCRKYYDGCNTCEKMGLEEVCTEKYCEEFGEPKCLDEIENINTQTYSSAKYSFQYPKDYGVEEPTKQLPALVIRGDKGRVEIFKNADFQDPLSKIKGERSHGYSSSGLEEHEAELVPKEKLKIGEYDVWLFYRKDDDQTKTEVRAIFSSIQLQ